MKRSCTITVVGDGLTGKTCMLMRYATGYEPDFNSFVPTVFDMYTECVSIDNQDVNVKLWDTSGQEDYEKIRTLCYNETNVFILCYSINNIISYKNCKHKWAKELRLYKKCPIVLVGTKIDLATPEERQQIAIEGLKMMKAIKASNFFLTSAITGENVQELMHQSIRVAITPHKKCVIL